MSKRCPDMHVSCESIAKAVIDNETCCPSLWVGRGANNPSPQEKGTGVLRSFALSLGLHVRVWIECIWLRLCIGLVISWLWRWYWSFGCYKMRGLSSCCVAINDVWYFRNSHIPRVSEFYFPPAISERRVKFSARSWMICGFSQFWSLRGQLAM
jgi:hypothetical protein